MKRGARTRFSMVAGHVTRPGRGVQHHQVGGVGYAQIEMLSLQHCQTCATTMQAQDHDQHQNKNRTGGFEPPTVQFSRPNSQAPTPLHLPNRICQNKYQIPIIKCFTNQHPKLRFRPNFLEIRRWIKNLHEYHGTRISLCLANQVGG